MTMKPEKDSFKPSRRSIVQGGAALIIALAYDEAAPALGQTAGARTACRASSPAAGAAAFLAGRSGPSSIPGSSVERRTASVTVYFGKIDVGQGTDSAIGQMVAEELDVRPFEADRHQDGRTCSRTVNQGDISGSTAVSNAGLSLRTTAAAARAACCSMNAAKQLNTTADKLAVSDGVITMTGDPSSRRSPMPICSAARSSTRQARLEQTDRQHAGGHRQGDAKIKTGNYKVIGKFFPRNDLPGQGLRHARLCPATSKSTAWCMEPRHPSAQCGHGAGHRVDGRSSIACRNPRRQGRAQGRFYRRGGEQEWDAIQAAAQAEGHLDGRERRLSPAQADLYSYIRNAKVNKSLDEVNVCDVDMAFAGAQAAGLQIVSAEYEWPFQSHASMGPGCAVADIKPDQRRKVLDRLAQETAFRSAGRVEIHRAEPADGKGFGDVGRRLEFPYGRNDDEEHATFDAVVMSQVTGKPVRVQFIRAPTARNGIRNLRPRCIPAAPPWTRTARSSPIISSRRASRGSNSPSTPPIPAILSPDN